MWNRYGFKDIVDYNNGVYFMKFSNEEGLDSVVNNGTWMTTKGISALASKVGKPLVMDAVTASMCKMGVGRVGFTRVMVEVSTKKPLPYEIEVAYRNVENKEI
ncbi:hypothetical protein Tco_0541351 [Tanacetum coccineum]